MPSKKRATPVSLQPLDALFGTNEESINGISEIAIGSLHPFPNHPFQVRDDKKMEELSESIIQYGVLVPGIVRLRESGGYELVAGHRRKRGQVGRCRDKDVCDGWNSGCVRQRSILGV